MQLRCQVPKNSSCWIDVTHVFEQLGYTGLVQ
jgi:hypothetical protein